MQGQAMANHLWTSFDLKTPESHCNSAATWKHFLPGFLKQNHSLESPLWAFSSSTLLSSGNLELQQPSRFLSSSAQRPPAKENPPISKYACSSVRELLLMYNWNLHSSNLSPVDLVLSSDVYMIYVTMSSGLVYCKLPWLLRRGNGMQWISINKDSPSLL